MKFEWDGWKAAQNLAKHGASFNQAAAVFDDPDALYRQDEAHSQVEPRWHVLGRAGPTILAVAYTLRGESIRLISARFASRRERRLYASFKR